MVSIRTETSTCWERERETATGVMRARIQTDTHQCSTPPPKATQQAVAQIYSGTTRTMVGAVAVETQYHGDRCWDQQEVAPCHREFKTVHIPTNTHANWGLHTHRHTDRHTHIQVGLVSTMFTTMYILYIMTIEWSAILMLNIVPNSTLFIKSAFIHNLLSIIVVVIKINCEKWNGIIAFSIIALHSSERSWWTLCALGAVVRTPVDW